MDTSAETLSAETLRTLARPLCLRCDSAVRYAFCGALGLYAVVLSSNVVLCMRCYCAQQEKLDDGESPSDIATEWLLYERD